MGGHSNGGFHSSVERFDPLTNEWSSVAWMNEGRYGAQAGVSGGYLYVVGGSNDRELHSSIERYDPQTSTWTMVIIFKWHFNKHRVFSLNCRPKVMNDTFVIADKLSIEHTS